MAGNFSHLLWGKLFADFEEKLGLPKQAAIPYLAQTFESILRNPKDSLTGPLVRNDKETIGKNLDALRDDPYFEVYSAFLKAFSADQTEEETYDYQ